METRIGRLGCSAFASTLKVETKCCCRHQSVDTDKMEASMTLTVQQYNPSSTSAAVHQYRPGTDVERNRVYVDGLDVVRVHGQDQQWEGLAGGTRGDLGRPACGEGGAG